MAHNDYEGIFAWIWRKLAPGPKPLVNYLVVEIEKGVAVTHADDDAAIASLKNHPGMIALLNRMKLRQAALRAQLETVRHKDIRDVDFLVTSVSWLGLLQREVNTAIGNLHDKKPRAATIDEDLEFKRLLSSIESIGATTPE
jgi:hypothetical protein